ncbi:MAG: class I SAM-dependent methyltransferase [Lewinellaceae bacterium]|nr:class I SAM-dependent methyltransferase [Saprospiraceae bacterium]MCB9332346.1 class I SAM-dependent methyltransferase [Lewinellaceae bacterium]
MTKSTIHQLVGNTDIYLLDQILKGRYSTSDRILDAGAGGGRNLHWFVQNGNPVYGVDQNAEAVALLKQHYPSVPKGHFLEAGLENLPFDPDFFDHIICCAVLHFANDPEHFNAMFAELIRVLKPGGTVFIRVATDVGVAEKMQFLGQGRFHMPDGTDRFLLTRPMLDRCIKTHQLLLLEPFKAVNVDNQRCMAAIVLQKG